MKTRLKLFLIAALTAWTLPGFAVDTVLHNFTVSEGSPAIFGSLTLGDGVLYGMTGNGGNGFVGTIYRINPDGSNYTVLHHFSNDGAHSDGVFPCPR